MFSDTHIHTDFSGDCTVPASIQVERAIALGMQEICITDHHDYDVISDTDFTLDIEAYLPSMERLRARYQDRIRVNIGVELGLQFHIKEYLDQLLLRCKFDFVIGSCHFVDGIDPYFPAYFEERSTQDGYERYFETTRKLAEEMDCFDSFGHLDYVVRYGPHQNLEFTYGRYGDGIDHILKTLIEKGKGLECNSSGFRCRLNQPNPCKEILTRYRELGGEILTIASDAHIPEHVGYEFHRLRELLLACGFRYYAVYHERKPDFYKI